jgi:hypothetical protein
MAALADRGIAVSMVQSPFRALAELCRAGRGASPAIVIVHPELLPDAVALLEAKARYAPGARCWMYGPADRPALRAIVESDIAGWGAPERPEVVVPPRQEPDSIKIDTHRERPQAHPARPAVPRLKLTEEPAPISPQADEPEPATAPLLSPEEIRMLLGDDEPGAAGER